MEQTDSESHTVYNIYSILFNMKNIITTLLLLQRIATKNSTKMNRQETIYFIQKLLKKV